PRRRRAQGQRLARPLRGPPQRRRESRRLARSPGPPDQGTRLRALPLHADGRVRRRKISRQPRKRFSQLTRLKSERGAHENFVRYLSCGAVQRHERRPTSRPGFPPPRPPTSTPSTTSCLRSTTSSPALQASATGIASAPSSFPK